MNEEHVTRTEFRPCPYCGKKVDALGEVEEEGARPKPGDYAVCLYCANVQRIGEELSFEKVSKEELKDIRKNEPELCRSLFSAQQAAIMFMAGRN